MQAFRLGLCGWGTVARAFHDLCERSGDTLAERYGVRLEVVAMSSRRLPQGLAVPQLPSVLDVPALDDLDAVVELIGGTDTATEIARRTLSSGKHLLTANKAMLVLEGAALGALARENSVRIGAEASLAGAIPVIRVLRSSFAFSSDQVRSIQGILNGTCNFILSAMERGQDFQAALKEAQSRGFAEADPTLDIDGSDAASKLALMLHFIYASELGADSVAAIRREGIEGLEPFDVAMAEKFGYRVRHLATALPHPTEGRIEARVHLRMVPRDRAMASVHNEINAVSFDCEAAGDQFFEGAGAGGEATASAVLTDALEIALNPDRTEQFGQASGQLKIAASEQYRCPRYLRLDLEHKPGTLARLTALTGELQINIDSISQHSTGDDKYRRVVLMLHPTTEQRVQQLFTRLAALPEVSGPPFQIRVGDGPAPA